MKRYIVQGFMTMILFAVMLPMRVSAASGDEFQVDRSGGVTLVSDHAADEGVSSLQFSLTVEPDGAADVGFEFYDSRAQITGSYYNAEENKLNVYMAGTKALFAPGSSALQIGRVVVRGSSGGDAPATVSIGENPLQYVYGSELKNMEGMEGDPVTINTGNSSTVTPTQVPPATEAPQPSQAPVVTAPPATQAPVVSAPPASQVPVVSAPPATQAPVVTAPPATQAPPVTTQEPQPTQPPQQPQPTETPGDNNGSQGGDNGSQGGNNGSQGGDNGSQGGNDGSQGGNGGSQGGNDGSQGGSGNQGGSAGRPKATTPPKKVVSASSGAAVKPQGTTPSPQPAESDAPEQESSSEEASEPLDIIEGDFGLDAEGSGEASQEENVQEPEKEEKGLDWVFVVAVVAIVLLCATGAAGFFILKKKSDSSRGRG